MLDYLKRERNLPVRTFFGYGFLILQTIREAPSQLLVKAVSSYIFVDVQ